MGRKLYLIQSNALDVNENLMSSISMDEGSSHYQRNVLLFIYVCLHVLTHLKKEMSKLVSYLLLSGSQQNAFSTNYW